MTRPIYSVRTSLGKELWWTTSRRKALEIAEQLNEPGRHVFPHSNGCVGYSDTEGLKPYDLPVAVHRCSVIRVAEVMAS